MGILNHLQTLFITSQVIAVPDVSAGYHDSVHSRLISVQQEGMIDSARAHQTNETNIGGVLASPHPRNIRPGISAPVTDETYNSGLKSF